MTKKEIQSADRAFALHKELLALKDSATLHFYKLGEIMKEIKENEYWKAMDYESFRAYFSDAELGFDESSVYRSIKMVEKFPEIDDLVQVPVGKILIILPHVTEKNRKQLLEAAKSLSRGDLIHQLGSGKDEEKPSKFAPLPKIYLCNTCGGVKGVSFDRLCSCGWTSAQRETISKAIEKIEFGGE